MKCFFKAAVLPLLLAVAGCVDISYVGQKFSPTPMSKPVTFYSERGEIPPDVYTIIGRFTILMPRSRDGVDVQKLLLETGREYGGDAIFLVSNELILVGTYTRKEAEFGGPSPAGENPGNFNPDGTPRQIDSFGEEQELQGETRAMQRRQIKALLLKDRKTTAKIMEERVK